MAQGFQSDIPPAINQTAKKYIRGMMKGKRRWNRLYGSRDKEVMHKTANKMAMGEMSKMPPTYYDIYEKAKSRAQQRFFGMVRAAQKGEMENPSPEVAKVAATAKRSDVKKFASTKHKKLPEKVVSKEETKYDRYDAEKKRFAKADKKMKLFILLCMVSVIQASAPIGGEFNFGNGQTVSIEFGDREL